MKDFGFVKTAAVCPRVTVGAADKNVDNMLPLIKGAASSGAQIIALPELCITGYTCSDLFSQDRLIESAAAFAWVMLPMPSEAMTNRTQKIFDMCLNPSPRSI